LVRLDLSRFSLDAGIYWMMSKPGGEDDFVEGETQDQQERHQPQTEKKPTDLDFAGRSREWRLQGQDENSRFRGVVEALQAEVTVARQERRAAVSAAKKAVAKLAAAEERAQFFETELARAIASRSWKLTRPLRTLTGLLSAGNQTSAPILKSPEPSTEPRNHPPNLTCRFRSGEMPGTSMAGPD
jgi:hypothetical protein